MASVSRVSICPLSGQIASVIYPRHSSEDRVKPLPLAKNANAATMKSLASLSGTYGALVVSSTVPLAQDALTGPLAVAIAVASFLVLAFTRKDTLWVVLASAIIGLLAKL